MHELRKIQVTKGVYWIEVPEAQVYVLCGCPEDSVKHLIKQGLIQTRHEKGVTFETGPNVILLSDVLVQNGKFANLAEFPTLQMLYRQGMILPHHPNNTGLKPMIIGSEDQVEAQMQYIYRGNYGLISEEELLDAGASPELAQEFRNIKLKFAFGKITPTKDFLDSLIVKNKSVEIRNRVFVRRLRLNVYEFRYHDEFAIVDLNLYAYENYEAPYTLGYHNIKKEYFAIIHSGQGDGWDVNRPCMSSILMFQGKIFLIDAGPNILNTLFALGISINEVDGIFHTHAHDDHFAGLTTLMRADHRIRYYATRLVRTSVARKLSALVSMDENSFSDYFEVCDMEFDVWNNIEGLEVMPIFSPHPVETNIFIFRAIYKGGYKTYAHLADIVALDILNKMVTEDSTKIGISRKFFNRVKKEYLQKVDLKKIDVGGGLIHGNAEDFREDTTENIILAHTSLALSPQQKEIGSGAAFGMTDVLIPTNQNYTLLYAYEYLRSYFPSVPIYQLKILLNNPVITFNPETIIIKGGALHKEIFLILTGNVEQIHSKSKRHNTLSAGALVGEISGFNGVASTETYRASGFVQALRLPNHMYLEFIKQNDLYDSIKSLQVKQLFLQETRLFGNEISYIKQVKIAQSMSLQHYAEGKVFAKEECTKLYLVNRGRLHMGIDDEELEILSRGCFFGEEGVIFGMPSLFKVKVIESAEIYEIQGALLLDIPIIRWKLLEIFKKRRSILSNPDLKSNPIFCWRDEFSVNIREMDDHHRQLFDNANKLIETIGRDQEKSAAENALNFLIEYAEYHFLEEEQLLRHHNYAEHEKHKRDHKRLLEEVLEFRENIKKNNLEMKIEVLAGFFERWIIEHILTEDRKYGPVLNAKGVF